MTWVKFDDQYPSHRKIAPLSDRRYRLANEAIFWSSRNLTDGRIRVEELSLIRPRANTADAADLVSRGIWHESAYECASEHCPPPGPDGWVIHDYWDYQPSRLKVEQERKAKATRQQRWRTAKSKGDATVDASTKASRNGNVDASQDALVTPAPSRPAPKEAGPGRPRVADDRRQAADAAAVGQPDDGSPPYPPPRRAAPPPVDLTAVRQQLRQAAGGFNAVGRRKADPLAELRAATEPPESGTTE